MTVSHPGFVTKKSTGPKIILPQHYALACFRFPALRADAGEGLPSTVSVRDKTKQFVLWLVGFVYLLSCWGCQCYRMSGFVNEKSSKTSISLFEVIKALPDITGQLRGPLVITLFYYDGPNISLLFEQIVRHSDLSQCRYNQLRRLCLLALLLSAVLLALQIAPWKILDALEMYTVGQNNRSSSTMNVTSRSVPVRDYWIGGNIELIYGTSSHFLSDQALIIVIFLCLIVRGKLGDLSKLSEELRADTYQCLPMKEYSRVIGQLSSVYEEVRIDWSKINREFMVVFGAAFGLDVVTMLGEVVYLVGKFDGHTFDSKLQDPRYVAAGIGLHFWAVIFWALHVLALAVPLVMVYEENIMLREKLSDREVDMSSVLQAFEGRSLKVSFDSLRKRMKGSHFCFQVAEIYYVTRSSVLATLTLMLTFALVGKEILS